MEKNYSIHYQKCKDIYADKNQIINTNKMEDINVIKIDYTQQNQALDLPPNYIDLVNKVSEKAKAKFEDKSCCFFPSNIDPKDDVVLRLKDKENFKFDEINKLCDIIIPQIEKKYYQCYLHADKVYLYRNIITDNEPRSSWKLHLDNHPAAIKKFMIYLTDVEEGCGEFEYLENKNGSPVMGKSSREGIDQWKPHPWPGSRVPQDVLDNYLLKGCRFKKILGNKGTMLLFSDNCLHRATIAKIKIRDVLVVQVRPIKYKYSPYVSPDFTGGFETNDLVKDPDEINLNRKNFK